MSAKHDGKNLPPEGGEEFIFRRFFTDPRTGITHDARKYGKRAWKIPVRRKRSE